MIRPCLYIQDIGALNLVVSEFTALNCRQTTTSKLLFGGGNEITLLLLQKSISVHGGYRYAEKHELNCSSVYSFIWADWSYIDQTGNVAEVVRLH